MGRFVNRELPQVPAELSYKQSTEQYFYFIQEAQIDNMDLSHGDWIVAYKEPLEQVGNELICKKRIIKD